MQEIPEYWRTEIYHPMSVHFPIALLFTAFLFKVVFLKWKKEVWGLGGTVLLCLGVLGTWVSIYTGDQADGLVSRTLCDPTVLKDHENMAYLTAGLFTSAVGVDILRFLKLDFLKLKNALLNFIIALIMAVGCGVLFYTAHLGGTLVYQQAAGVYNPSENCAEFN